MAEYKPFHKNNGVIDTPEEGVLESRKNMWEKDPEKILQIERIERRKLLNWSARFIITLIIFGIFAFLVWLLFFTDIRDASRDLVNIMLGAFVGVLAKAADYWFKEKDDPETHEIKEMSKTSTVSKNNNKCPEPECPSNKKTVAETNNEYSANIFDEEPKY